MIVYTLGLSKKPVLVHDELYQIYVMSRWVTWLSLMFGRIVCMSIEKLSAFRTCLTEFLSHMHEE